MIGKSALWKWSAPIALLAFRRPCLLFYAYIKPQYFLIVQQWGLKICLWLFDDLLLYDIYDRNDSVLDIYIYIYNVRNSSDSLFCISSCNTYSDGLEKNDRKDSCALPMYLLKNTKH